MGLCNSKTDDVHVPAATPPPPHYATGPPIVLEPAPRSATRDGRIVSRQILFSPSIADHTHEMDRELGSHTPARGYRAPSTSALLVRPALPQRDAFPPRIITHSRSNLSPEASHNGFVIRNTINKSPNAAAKPPMRILPERSMQPRSTAELTALCYKQDEFIHNLKEFGIVKTAREADRRANDWAVGYGRQASAQPAYGASLGSRVDFADHSLDSVSSSIHEDDYYPTLTHLKDVKRAISKDLQLSSLGQSAELSRSPSRGAPWDGPYAYNRCAVSAARDESDADGIVEVTVTDV